MNTYTLQAMTQDSVQAVPIEALDDEDATFQAIDQIMGRAMTSPTWAIGHITLTSPDGRLVREMLAKRGKGDEYDANKGLPVFSKSFSAMSGL
jgi:hypothetical protein